MNFHTENHIPGTGWIWVFGSNESGNHAVGDARIAKNNFGACYGVASGRMRDSYAIPARNRHMVNLPVEVLKTGIDTFLEYARSSEKEQFFVTRVGCTPGGFADSVIAPLFSNAPANCFLPASWQALLLGSEARQ